MLSRKTSRARTQTEAEPTLSWQGATREQTNENEWRVVLHTDRGDIETRYHPAADAQGARGGAVWVGGAGGGLDGPAQGLYAAACRRLQAAGVAGLRLHYRHPNHLQECVLDTLLGVEFLAGEGIGGAALIGHSFGGAVVIAAGALSDRVRAVVPMSTQTYGTDLAPAVAPRALLLVHGTADRVLPDVCSRQVLARAGEPKELVLYQGAGHGLDECRQQLLDLLTEWIPRHLS